MGLLMILYKVSLRVLGVFYKLLLGFCEGSNRFLWFGLRVDRDPKRICLFEAP